MLLRRAASFSGAIGAGFEDGEAARGVATGARVGGGLSGASCGWWPFSLLPRKPMTVHSVLVPQYAARGTQAHHNSNMYIEVEISLVLCMLLGVQCI